MGRGVTAPALSSWSLLYLAGGKAPVREAPVPQGREYSLRCKLQRTLSYRYTESILPVDASIYVLGTLQENGEIGNPPPENEEQRFVISYRSEEALVENLSKNALWLSLGAIGAFILGVLSLLIGVFVPMA